MKKLLFLLFLIPVISFGQGTTTIKVKKLYTDTAWIMKMQALPSSAIVLVWDSLTGKIGKRPFPTGGGGSGDSYWTVSGNYIRNIDTTNYFQWYNGDGTNSAQIYGDPMYLKMEIDYPDIYAGGKVEIAPEEGRTGLNSKYGTKWAQVDLYGIYNALIPSGNTVIDLGYSSVRWGVFYGTSANVTGTVTASGGNSTNWNTAYSQRLSSASGTSPLTLTLSSNALTGSIAQAGSSSSGYLSSSDWTKFNAASEFWELDGEGGINTDYTKVGAAEIRTPLIVGGTAAGSQIIYKSTTGAGTSSGIAHQFTGGTNGGTVAMTILNDGKIGIGTASPTAILHTSTANSFQVNFVTTGTNKYALFNLQNTNGSVYIGKVSGASDVVASGGLANSGILAVTGNNSLQFGTNNSAHVTINGSGNTGIGTTAPATKLHVRDGAIRAGVTVRADMDSTIYKLTAAGKGVVISTDSAIRLHGTSTVWDDLMMPFTTGENAGTGYPAFNADSLWYNFVIDTASLTKCIIYMPVQMPHSWKEGSTVYPHVHYHHTTAQGTPTFKVKYKWVNTGSLTGDWKWLTMATTSGTTNNTHQMCYSTAGIPGTGKTISSILLCMIYLTAQTGTGGIDAYQFDIHYEINSLGSNTDTSKN